VNFFLDHDVPGEVAHLLRHWGHDVLTIRQVLPVTASDKEVFDYAQSTERVIVSCNRDHFLALVSQSVAEGHPFSGLVILVRRRSRQAECAHFLQLLRQAGDQGLTNNINFA
jgi:predicted nuclease of predicted toxin-antitoxin system